MNILLIDLSFNLTPESGYRIKIIESFLSKNWHNIVSYWQDFDYILINTFWYFWKFINRILFLLNYKYKKTNKNKIIIYWELAWDKSLNNIWCNIIKVWEEYKFNNLFYKNIKIEDIENKTINHWEIELCSDDNSSFTIDIVKWCRNNCTLCIINKKYKNIISESENSIIEQIKFWISKWYFEITLLWDDIWSYGLDIWTSLTTLLEKICSLEWFFSINISYIDPLSFLILFNDIKKYLYKISFIYIPIVSLDQNLLRKLGRFYDPHKVINIISFIKNQFPNIDIDTTFYYDIPWETFKDIINVFKNIKVFDGISIRKFDSYYYNWNIDLDSIDLEKKEMLIKKISSNNKSIEIEEPVNWEYYNNLLYFK